MPRTRPLRALLPALAAAAALSGGLAACGGDEGTAGEAALQGAEAFREGLAEELAGLEYNVFLTRQLNLNLPEDKFYYDGPPAPPGSSLYGVFLEVCNRDEEGEPHLAADRFTIVDSQGAEFEPVEVEEDNQFAYRAEVLAPERCIPARGSVAQLGPSGGAVLIFQLPQEATENRPLELEIFPPEPAEGEEPLRFEIDI